MRCVDVSCVGGCECGDVGDVSCGDVRCGV